MYRKSEENSGIFKKNSEVLWIDLDIIITSNNCTYHSKALSGEFSRKNKQTNEKKNFNVSDFGPVLGEYFLNSKSYNRNVKSILRSI